MGNENGLKLYHKICFKLKVIDIWGIVQKVEVMELIGNHVFKNVSLVEKNNI